MPVSPGIFAREFDFSTYAAELGLTKPVFVGGATKGVEDEAVLIRNPGELIDIFGPPVTSDYGLQAALQYLAKGDNLRYMRVADSTAVAADRTASGTSGGTAAVKATGDVTFTASTNPADGETIVMRDGADAVAATTQVELTGAVQPADAATLILDDQTNPAVTFEFDSDSSVSETDTLRQVVIGANATETMANLLAAINNAPTLDITANDITTGDPEIELTAGQPGTVGNTYTAVAAGATPPTVDHSPFTLGSNGTSFLRT